jgi:hypothetical protein
MATEQTDLLFVIFVKFDAADFTSRPVSQATICASSQETLPRRRARTCGLVPLCGVEAPVAEFLDITTPDVIWPQLVEAASFESMKRDGGRLMHQLDSLLDRGHQNFFYKGTNSRWCSVLTDPDVDL